MNDDIEKVCTQCGAPVFEINWGNGGRMLHEVAEPQRAHPPGCDRCLKTRIAALEAELANARRRIEHDGARLDDLGSRLHAGKILLERDSNLIAAMDAALEKADLVSESVSRVGRAGLDARGAEYRIARAKTRTP